VAALRWLTEVFEPIVESIPEHLRSRLDPAEVFHEVLEHRWFLSESAGRDVGTTAAAEDYVAHVLPDVPEDLVTPAGPYPPPPPPPTRRPGARGPVAAPPSAPAAP
jgi:hypothetical protein